MELELYQKLDADSKKAIKRKTTTFGNPYRYKPRGDLIQRLALETGKSKSQIFNQLMKERKMLTGEY